MTYDLTLDQVRTLEARGRDLAQQCKWSGEEILAIAVYALEDSNYHTEASKIRDVIDDLDSR